MKNLLLAICLLVAYRISAQDPTTVDSLNKQIVSTDTTQINKAIDALNIAKRISYEKGQGDILHKIGTMYELKGNYKLALEKYLQCASIRERTGEDEKRAFVYINISYLFDLVERYDEAIRYSEEALKLTKNIQLKCYAYTYIGKGKMKKGRGRGSVSNFKKAVALKVQNNLTGAIHEEYNSLANAYISIKGYDSAIINLEKALPYSKNNHSVLARLYGNLGVANHLKGNDEEAAKYYKKAIELNVKEESGGACLNIAELYYNKGEARIANEYLYKALAFDYDLSHLAKTLNKLHKYQEAFTVLDCLHQNSTQDYELLRDEGVELVKLESEMLRKAEREALNAKYEAERTNKLSTILVAIVILAVVAKYIVKYYNRAKSAELFKKGLLDIIKVEEGSR